ncbi:MAG: FAD-dependent oxidoreductase [Nitriliruptorales bacterium]|nr:FAD-dependent oxidoreductase [Nitriliruptorales bacterium]
MSDLPGTQASYWIESTSRDPIGSAPAQRTVDVAVIGAGMVGLTAADLLKKAGSTVAVIEMHGVAEGVSGYTTAKISAGQGTRYSSLTSKYDEETARAYAASNTAALEYLAALVEAEGVDCEFARKDNYVFAASDEEVSSVEREAEAAAAAGLATELVSTTPLPFDVPLALRQRNQAQFHPRKYLLHLARNIDGDGSFILENTRATGVSDGSPCRIETTDGDVTARDVIVATQLPFLDRGLFFARAHPYREHVVTVRVPGSAVPDGMFISAGSPTRSVRSTPYGDGALLIVSGEKHKTGAELRTDECYRRLQEWAEQHFEVLGHEYRWSAQDYYPVDALPYIGKLNRMTQHLYTATGFAAWGMTNGTLAAMLLSDAILGRENPWASLYDSNRINPIRSATAFVKENVKVAGHFVGDRLSKEGADSTDDLAPGEAAVVGGGGTPVAAYRDPGGLLHAVSARCTHMGCLVKWNHGERSWDCPCHGSRFAPDGTVLNGPAARPLESQDVGG